MFIHILLATWFIIWNMDMSFFGTTVIGSLREPAPLEKSDKKGYG
jgi:hypothetical protein